MKILIATDGSEFSHSAIEKACEIIADPKNTQIKIVSVFHDVEPLDLFRQSVEYAQQIQKTEEQNAEQFVSEASAILERKLPEFKGRVATEILKGAVDVALLEAAKIWQADIVVVGSHGRKFWERHIVGSVCDALVHHAPCSVFVVRPVN